MRIIITQLLLPIACYFIGVAVGKASEKNKVEIQHVGYTPEQMGYDK